MPECTSCCRVTRQWSYPKDYEKCSMIMAVCTNMVQQTIANAAIESGIQVSEAIKNMDAWVTGFVRFPFPFFTFQSQQDDTYD